MKTTESWIIIDILKESTQFLQSKGIESARRNAEELLASALSLSRIELYMQFDRPLSVPERDLFKPLLRRRGQHEPLQYILGEVEFYGLPFKVTPDVLIPRPETELLIDKAIEIIGMLDHQNAVIQILDIGTGSGNIAIALAKKLKNIRVTGIDCSKDTLRIAEENASRHQVSSKIEFQQADIFQDGFLTVQNRPFDILLSNPPYVSVPEMKALPVEVRDFEPAIALEAGSDGLSYYRRIAAVLPRLVKSGGNILMEIGSTQRDSIQTIFSAVTDSHIEFFQDLSGLDRMVHFQVSGGIEKT